MHKRNRCCIIAEEGGSFCDMIMEVAAIGWQKPESICRAGRKEKTAKKTDLRTGKKDAERKAAK